MNPHYARHYKSKFIVSHYTWQALSREKKMRNLLARNFSREIRCEKCEKSVLSKLANFSENRRDSGQKNPKKLLVWKPEIKK